MRARQVGVRGGGESAQCGQTKEPANEDDRTGRGAGQRHGAERLHRVPKGRVVDALGRGRPRSWRERVGFGGRGGAHHR